MEKSVIMRTLGLGLFLVIFCQNELVVASKIKGKDLVNYLILITGKREGGSGKAFLHRGGSQAHHISHYKKSGGPGMINEMKYLNII